MVYMFFNRNEMIDIFSYGTIFRSDCMFYHGPWYKPHSFAFGFNKVLMAD